MLQLRTFGGLSIEANGAPLTGAAVQRKTLALLSLLAAAGKNGVSRDKLVAYLWPESDAEHSRSLLKQACYALRRDLHEPELFLGTTELRFNPEAITSDMQVFEEALRVGDRSRAVEVYCAPFLDGFYLNEAEEFERWVEDKRARLAEQARDALESLATAAAASGDARAAVAWWRRLTALDPLNSHAAVGLMTALAALGERGAAIEHGLAHAAFLQAELHAAPPSAVTELVERLRHGSGDLVVKSRDRRAVAGPEPVKRETPPRRRRSARAGLITAGSLVLVAAGIAALSVGTHGSTPVLAVGAIRDYADTDDAAPTVAEMLATNLARVPRLHVLSTARLYELLGSVKGPAQESTEMTRVARAARANQLLEGALYRRPGNRLRLELQRIDVQSGVVLGAYAVEGKDAFAVTDSATAALAASFGVSADTIRVADVTTRSFAAYRLYVAGLRALYRDEDSPGALRMFEAALAEDSGFAMAAYYAGVIDPILSGPESHLAQAVRLAAYASDRERLLIRAAWAREAMDPGDLAIAETLAIRYPAELDGHYLLGIARMWQGDFLGAVAALRVVVAMDSLGLRGATVRCRGCEALANIVTAYGMADSLPAAERAAREFLVLQPRSTGARLALAVTLEHAGRFDEALTAYDSVLHLSPTTSDNIYFRVPMATRRGDFAEADALLRPNQRHATPAQQWGAWWWRSTSFRYQGRLREALAIAREMRAVEYDSVTSPPRPPYNASLIRGAVLLEMGHAREAAALFDSLATFYARDRLVGGRYARYLCWTLTHRASALAAAGDTTVLQRLADSLEVLGPQSSYGRDRRLHHHVRGLLLLARGRPGEAAVEFREAVFSPTYGYTRTNLELARALMIIGRPRDAVAVLQPALRGPLDASNLYVTHTELHEMLARAFEAAGEGDSAVAHYRWVVHAWRRADPEFQPRRDFAQRRLAALEARLGLARSDP